MSIHITVAVTDYDWYRQLSSMQGLSEVNFWSPSDQSFKALKPGELFLFKLRKPHDAIVGGGVFAYANSLPCSLAWEAFKEANGATSAQLMRANIAKYKQMAMGDKSDFAIGCRILTQPFFFHENNWMPVPADWSKHIVQYKTYRTEDQVGMWLWRTVARHLSKEKVYETFLGERYGAPQIVRPRLGQGAFRVMVTDLYDRRCVISRERTLPALEAAHIQPYSLGGPHAAKNGLLFRRDIHSLFDAGYVTVTPELDFEVSQRIREEFENGKHYYELHGRKIQTPKDLNLYPDKNALRWNNENCFKG